MQQKNKNILLDGDLSETLYSNPIRLENVYGLSFQAVHTVLTGAANFKLQMSNDMENSQEIADAVGVTNWTDIASSTKNITASGSEYWNIDSANYRWMRFVSEPVSGTGTVNVRVQVKGV